MNKNLDLTEILKDCPIGTKFYSSYLGKDVFFTGINNNYIECEYLPQIDSPFNSMIQFRKEGSLYKGGECMLFPSKDQRDWFKWHRPFKDGDILTFMFWRKPTIYIYRENGTHNTSYYAAYSSENNKFYGDGTGALASNRDDLRFATEEEKQKLFDVLKKEGYKWDAEKKELKTLQSFKDGDIVATNDGKYIAIIENNGGEYYVCCHPNVNYFNIDGSGWFDRLATEEEKATLFQAINDNGCKWNVETKTLEKLIEPKFKVGDVITSKNGISMYKITNVTPEYYSTKVPDHACVGLLPVRDQDNWILVPNKFDPKTLQPFDRIIVRDFDNQKWVACLFSHIENGAYHKFKTVAGLGWHQCIPFNNDTKHLVGKMDKAPEFYKYWKE